MVDVDSMGPDLQLVGARCSNFLPGKVSLDFKLHGMSIFHGPIFLFGGGYRSPQNVNICPKLWVLATGSRHNEHIQMKFGL